MGYRLHPLTGDLTLPRAWSDSWQEDHPGRWDRQERTRHLIAMDDEDGRMRKPKLLCPKDPEATNYHFFLAPLVTGLAFCTLC